MDPWIYVIGWVITGYVGFLLLTFKGYSVSSSMAATEEREFNETRGVPVESFHGATFSDRRTHIGYGVLPMVLGPFLLIAGLLLLNKRHPRNHKR